MPHSQREYAIKDLFQLPRERAPLARTDEDRGALRRMGGHNNLLHFPARLHATVHWPNEHSDPSGLPMLSLFRWHIGLRQLGADRRTYVRQPTVFAGITDFECRELVGEGTCLL